VIRPRNTLLVAVLFLVIATIYYALSQDAGGTTMLVALAIGMGLLSYTLALGSPKG
jgi:uncharacterized protein (UPF0333 family)